MKKKKQDVSNILPENKIDGMILKKNTKKAFKYILISVVNGKLRFDEKHNKQMLNNRRKPFMSTPAEILKRVTKTVKVTNIAASFMSFSFMASDIYYDLSKNVF